MSERPAPGTCTLALCGHRCACGGLNLSHVGVGAATPPLPMVRLWRGLSEVLS